MNPRIKIDNAIHVSNIDAMMKARLRQMATVVNPKWDIARREGFYGVNPTINLWELKNGLVVVPRGYIGQLKRGFQRLNQPIIIEDHRKISRTLLTPKAQPDLHPWQIEAKDKLLAAEQGIYQAPPGSGKTVTALSLITAINQTTLIIVEKVELANQWINRAKEHFGIDIGLIGAGKYDLKVISVALQQTLWSRRDELDRQDFWKLWGCVIVDECHHTQARTFQNIIHRFPAKYRYGLSATPAKSLNTWPLIRAYLGDIVASSEAEVPQKASNQAIPEQFAVDRRKPTKLVGIPTIIRLQKTDFSFNYLPTVFYGKKVIRNNYSALVNSLILDNQRNDLILKYVIENKDKSCILLSRRLNQIDYLYNSLSKDIKIKNAHARVERLTGKESPSERKRIVELANEENIILLSTVADEGLDIPRLSHLFLVFPTANVQTVKQQIGRIQRKYPGKEECVVYDFWDDTGPLAAQYYKRYSFYTQSGFIIDMGHLSR